MKKDDKVTQVTMKMERVLDSEAPVTRFRYDEETRILFVWWRNKRRGKFGGGETCYLHLGVPKRVVARLQEINVSKATKEKAAKHTEVTAVPSVGTYINTKIKKYVTLNVSLTTVNDLMVEATRIRVEVPTRSTKKIDRKPTTKAEIQKVVEEGIKKGNLKLVGGYDVPQKKIPGIGSPDGDIDLPLFEKAKRRQ